MNYKTLSFTTCDRYQTWGAEVIVNGEIIPYPRLSREEVLINFDDINKELVESSEKTAQFLYETLSEYLDNVSVVVEIINYFSFWSVYIDDKPICEDVTRTGVMNRVFNIVIFEIRKGENKC